jgi:hypothetical protein
MQHFTDRIDRRYAKICLYAGVTVVLTVVAIMVLRFASPVFAKLWLLICAVAEPMIYGAAISYLLNPLVTGISHFLRDRGILVKNSSTRRVIAIAISLLIVLVLICALVLVFGLMVTHSLSNISLMSIYDLFNAAQGDATDLFGRVEGFLSEMGIANAGGGDYDFQSDRIGDVLCGLIQKGICPPCASRPLERKPPSSAGFPETVFPSSGRCAVVGRRFYFLYRDHGPHGSGRRGGQLRFCRCPGPDLLCM